MIDGYRANQKICFESDGVNCIKGGRFLAVTKTEGLSSLVADGIVGLNPQS